VRFFFRFDGLPIALLSPNFCGGVVGWKEVGQVDVDTITQLIVAVIVLVTEILRIKNTRKKKKDTE
jgi:hypothetical protein